MLYEQRDAIAADLVKSVQGQLDRLKAGQDRDRLKNEGQSYANDVIPRAKGAAARLKEESDGYSARILAQAEGDSQRFRSVLTEYQKAPGVTRDRLYIETMQQVYSNVSKVMVDSRSASNLLYLPLDKLLQQAGVPAAAPAVTPSSVPTPATLDPTGTQSVDIRSRDGARGRDREGR